MKSHSLPPVLVISLSIGAAISLALLTFVKKNKKIFVGKTIVYIVITVFLSAIIGTSGYLLRNSNESFNVSPAWLYIWLEIILIALGCLHFFLLYKVNPWARRESFVSELVFTLILSLLSAIAFILVFHWMDAGDYALVFVTVFLFFPLPFLVVKAYDLWIAIPARLYRPWYIPVEQAPPVIEKSDQFLEITFHIPISQNSTSVAQFSVRTPLNKSLGDLFYYLVYRHNEQEKLDPQIPDIEIAEGNRRDGLYGWLFSTHSFQTKKYIDPDLHIHNVLYQATHIFVERVRK